MNYASLSDRIKAFTIDQILLIVTMFITSELLSNFENVPTSLRMLLFISFFFLYEPICISFFKGTIGQQYINIKVEKDNDQGTAVNFFLVIIRTLLKYSLGWISLLTISSSPKKQAIHDSIVKSIVLRN
ncbi:putative RDD family membrane protein YckC [Nonlabens xylanidelens]|uniref:Putative RDD family membrane protein YckC n=1 Tax=Nonlabens xylanidelens TaxID=191564 RepID=A0A2S6IPX9_9FLAO|nr:RDD family protein [Nonlabens xylanidelens]PPK96225.1 putative RDD family membrane protein YckC [Nonlabens xylanidelens]PQJ17967.1 RDD family protein [Nonlabens xylanidelens]